MDRKSAGLRKHGYFRGFLPAAAVPLLLLAGAPESYGGGMGGCGMGVDPNTFNAVDSGANAVSGKITTKIAGASGTAAGAMKLDIYGIDTGTSPDSVQACFSGTVQVELLGSQTPAAALGNYTCPSGFNTTLISSQNVTLSSGAGSVTLPAVADAWRNVYVRISYTSGMMGGTITGCSSDNFAIRPDRFASVSVTDSDWQTAGTGRTLGNTGVSGGNVHKAGRPFTILATAVNAAGTPAATANYAGSPAPTLTQCGVSGGGCPATLGTLTPGTWSASGGTVTTTTASYSEVGAFAMQLADSSFASVDANDGSTPSQLTIASTALNVGRFVPDHFDLAPNNTPQFQTFGAAGAGRSFTYLGQPFGYVTAPQALITARNASGGTTQNYSGNLWKVAAANVTQAYSPLPASPALDIGLIGTPTVIAHDIGTGVVTANASDKLAFIRSPSAPQAAFNADITLTMSAVDGSEAGVSGNGTIATNTSAQFNGTGGGIAFDAGSQFRYGRLKLGNAFGSELLALPVPLQAQWWNGTAFVTNTADNGTTIPSANVTLGNYQGQLQAGETSVSISGSLAGGRSNLTLSKPAGGDGKYTGSVDLSVDLSAAGANLPWLRGNWAGGSYDQNPTARAAFGMYGNSGGNGLIYQRENF